MLQHILNILYLFVLLSVQWIIIQVIQRPLRHLQLPNHLLIPSNIRLKLNLLKFEVFRFLLAVELLFTEVYEVGHGAVLCPIQIIFEEMLVHTHDIADVYHFGIILLGRACYRRLVLVFRLIEAWGGERWLVTS